MRGGLTTKSLGDVCRFIDYRGRTPEKAERGLRLITAKNVKMGFLQMHPMEFVDPETYESWMTRGIPKIGDVIFTTEAPLANVAQLDTDERVVFAQRIVILQPTESGLDRAFLKYFLMSETAQRHIRESGTGATVQGIKASLLKKIEIVFPPLAEQKRIVGILDEAFDGIATANANAEKNLQNARALFESHLEAVFSQRREGWSMEPLDKLTNLARGHNPPKSKFSHEPKPGYVRFYQIRDGATDDYAVYVPDTPQLHKMEADDIMMVAYRHVGRVFRGVAGAFNVALCKISNARRDLLDDDYLFHILPSRYVKGELLKRSERSLIPSMSIEHLRELQIPLPPLFEQHRIVGIIKSLSAETKRLESIYQQKLAALEELKKSLLHQAFSGQL